MESLGGLMPAFDPKGTVTAGNASQLSDGGLAIVMMSKRAVEARGITPLAEVLSYGMVAGPDNTSLLHQPSNAILKALAKIGKQVSDISLFEINEAFAAQAVYCVRELGIDPAKVNVNGGAIALGHPLGCTGARQMATLLAEMKRRGARYGVISMCIGGGMGAAAVVERA